MVALFITILPIFFYGVLDFYDFIVIFHQVLFTFFSPMVRVNLMCVPANAIANANATGHTLHSLDTVTEEWLNVSLLYER